jgi:hypothetical protein
VVEQDAVRAHWACDVLDLLLAHITEGNVELVAHLVAHDPVDANATGLGEGFEAGGDIDTVAENVALIDGQVIFRSREAVTADHLDDVWPQAAQAVMLEVSPYRVALALYDTDPEAAMRLADSIIRRYPPADENVAWARLLRGARNLDSLQYSAAECYLPRYSP